MITQKNIKLNHSTQANIDSYSDYRYKFIQQEFGQVLGVIFLIASLIAFFWLIMPVNHNNKKSVD